MPCREAVAQGLRRRPPPTRITPTEAGTANSVVATNPQTGQVSEAAWLMGATAEAALSAAAKSPPPPLQVILPTAPAPAQRDAAIPPPPVVPASSVRVSPRAGASARIQPTPTLQPPIAAASKQPLPTPVNTATPVAPNTANTTASKPVQPVPTANIVNRGFITILHFNDWHVRMEPCTEAWHALCDSNRANQRVCSGGIARMKKWLDDSRSKLDPATTLTLNAGDDFIGTVWDRKYGVDLSAHFLGQLGINVSAIGNHEFDWGTDKLVDYLGMLPYPVVGACNLDVPSGHALGKRVRVYTSHTIMGAKVCVLGLATRDVLPDKTWPIKVKDPYWYGKQCVADLKRDGCQVIILLSHLGYTADIVAAQLIPGLDLVIGGHSHSLLWNGEAPAWDKAGGRRDDVWGTYPTWVDSKVEPGRKVPVVQAGWGSRYMGTVRLWLAPADNRGPGKPLITKVEGWPAMLGGDGSDAPYSEDSGMVAELRKWRYWKD